MQEHESRVRRNMEHKSSDARVLGQSVRRRIEHQTHIEQNVRRTWDKTSDAEYSNSLSKGAKREIQTAFQFPVKISRNTNKF